MQQVFFIARIAQTIANGNRFETPRERISIHVLRDVGGMYDLGEAHERRVLEVILEHERLERTAPILVTQFDSRSIKGNGARLLRHRVELTLWDKDEFRFIV